MNTTNLFSCFGDIIELDLSKWNLDRTLEILKNHNGWKQYNPRKDIKRYGLSVTSLDGSFSGVPDLDSLLEYNKEHNTRLTEKDFTTLTPIVEDIPELANIVELFGSHTHRSHFLRLDAGGFFPHHRDNGKSLPSQNMRIIVPLIDVGGRHLKWIHDGELTKFNAGIAYCVNTTKDHCIFSFTDNCYMLVLNIQSTTSSVQTILNHLAVR
jgi:hypothetical protein